MEHARSAAFRWSKLTRWSSNVSTLLQWRKCPLCKRLETTPTCKPMQARTSACRQYMLYGVGIIRQAELCNASQYRGQRRGRVGVLPVRLICLTAMRTPTPPHGQIHALTATRPFPEGFLPRSTALLRAAGACIMYSVHMHTFTHVRIHTCTHSHMYTFTHAHSTHTTRASFVPVLRWHRCSLPRWGLQAVAAKLRSTYYTPYLPRPLPGPRDHRGGQADLNVPWPWQSQGLLQGTTRWLAGLAGHWLPLARSRYGVLRTHIHSRV